jgi:hypothetical protein
MNEQVYGPIPAARIEGLVVTESRDDVLVYDTEHHHIHHLNQVSAAVWRSCDGRRSIPDVTRTLRATLPGEINDEVVRLALTKLESAGLLSGALEPHVRTPGQSRRKFLRRAAVAGAVAVPIVLSISAPSSALAGSSACGQDCTAENANSECNGFCSQCGPDTGPGSGSICCAPGEGHPEVSCDLLGP